MRVFDYTAYLLAGLPVYPPTEDKLSLQEKVAGNVAGPLVRVYQCFKTVGRETCCSSYGAQPHRGRTMGWGNAWPLSD